MTLQDCYCPDRNGSRPSPCRGHGPVPAPGEAGGDPWIAFGYLVAGVLLYGGAGLGTGPLAGAPPSWWFVGILFGRRTRHRTRPGRDSRRPDPTRRRSSEQHRSHVEQPHHPQRGIRPAGSRATSILPPIGRWRKLRVPWSGTGRSAVTKPMLQLVIAAVLVFGFFCLAIRAARHGARPAAVRRRGRLRRSCATRWAATSSAATTSSASRPTCSRCSSSSWSTTSSATIPFFQFPTFSRSGMVYGLAALSWLIYNGVGIKKHGFARLPQAAVRSRPASAARSCCCWCRWSSSPTSSCARSRWRCDSSPTCSPGHLLLILFALGGEYLLVEAVAGAQRRRSASWPGCSSSSVAFLELLVQFLQAYVFVLLNAMYIQVRSPTSTEPTLHHPARTPF